LRKCQQRKNSENGHNSTLDFHGSLNYKDYRKKLQVTILAMKSLILMFSALAAIAAAQSGKKALCRRNADRWLRRPADSQQRDPD